MQASAEPIRSIVGKFDAFFLGAELSYGEHGSENLFLNLWGGCMIISLLLTIMLVAV